MDVNAELGSGLMNLNINFLNIIRDVELPLENFLPENSTLKILTWNIPTHFFNYLSSLNTLLINGRKVYIYICFTGRKILIFPEQLRIFS